MTRFQTSPTRLADIRGNRERGSAPVSFLLTSLLLLGVFLGLLQTALVMHSRNVLVDIASEAARQGGRLGASSADAEAYALSAAAGAVTIDSVQSRYVDVGQQRMLHVTVNAQYPLLGALVSQATMTVTGRSIVESL